MPSSSPPERFAVCIGINDYHPSVGLNPLRYAEDDARAMDALLGQLGFAPQHRSLLLGKEATLEAINEALSTYILDLPEEQDLVVFYFAGHSLPLIINQREVQQGLERRSEIFLVPFDFEIHKAESSLAFRKRHALGMERLRQEFFEGTGSCKRLFLFDSCYSGDFFGPGYRDGSNPIQGYIKHMLNTRSIGRLALSSCLPFQEAIEDSNLRGGYFTHYVLEALSGRAVEALDRNGCLTVNGLFEYLAKKLPENQRPVLSGVQQDTFMLVCYGDERRETSLSTLQSEEAKRAELEQRLRALLADHTVFMRDRLESFVGRQNELAEIKQRIADKLRTGGYVTITGKAGQGKSSIIVKLVAEYDLEKVAYHFIPFNPGPDHQIGLLRNLMAHLILKYGLSDLYLASESRAALRDYFPHVLEEVAERGGKEVIFIDGLDQLEEELTGVRDLTFLPNNPPPGIVFVLGTRPNDTLRPLELLKPYYEYQLPNLSRQDFDLILQHRHVFLDRSLASQFYQTMQENALYLDLVAKELAEKGGDSPKEVIAQIADNPENLFRLSMVRLKRHSGEWHEVIKPVLGVLMVAREPLALRHIRQILDIEDDRLREGIERLGGLVARDWQQRYSLFHLKLYEFLRQNELLSNKVYIFAKDEEKSWHNKLAGWCDQGRIEIIWQDINHDSAEQGRREYARQHYLTHLYYAHEWQRLFDVLDTVQYGKAKIRYDPSTHSYSQDLNFGRQVAAWKGWTLEEGIKLLPRLWHYTLLCCCLKSRADQYPESAFRLLVLLRRKREALGLAELLTKPAYKARVMLLIADELRKQTDQEMEWLEVILRAAEISYTVKGNNERIPILEELGRALIQAEQWEQAEKAVHSIGDHYRRTKALGELGKALAQAQQWGQARRVWDEAEKVAYSVKLNNLRTEVLRELGEVFMLVQQWERAERVIRTIEAPNERIDALQSLSRALAQAQQWESAQRIWETVEKAICAVEDSDEQARSLRELGISLARAQQWEQTEKVISEMQDNYEQSRVLRELGIMLVRAEQWEQAQRVWNDAEKMVRSIEDFNERSKGLGELGIALAQAQQRKQAQRMWAEVERRLSGLSDEALRELGMALIQAQQWQQAEKVIGIIRLSYWQTDVLKALSTALAQTKQWKQAEKVISEIKDNYERCRALLGLGAALTEAQQREQARRIWIEAKVHIYALKDNYQRVKVLQELGSALAQAQQWEQAQRVWNEAENDIHLIGWSSERSRALRELGAALAQAQQWEQAQRVWNEAEKAAYSIEWIEELATSLGELGTALVHAGKWEQAQRVWNEAEKQIYSTELSDERTKALRGLRKALVKARQWERADTIVRMIEDQDEQVRALRELARNTSAEGNSERLLSLIQNSWWQAGTREEALKLFPLSTEFVQSAPDIGIKFLHGFTLANAFLKE